MFEPSGCAHQSDADLIRACLNGQELAWKELVERYGRLVYSIPLRYGLASPDADEVFQNVFVIVHRRLKTLRDQKMLAPWLITVTQHEAQRVARLTRHHIELDEAMPDGADALVDQVRRWERQHAVRQALEQLDPRCRALLSALFLESEHLSYAQVAARLGIGIGSIGPTRSRCFKKLEAILKAMEIDLDS